MVAVVIAGCALAFTVGSFWWLHARRGRLEVPSPQSYAFAIAAGRIRLRLPLAFYNTGAISLLVKDLRIAFVDDAQQPPLRWVTTRSMLRPDPNDNFAFATPFAVAGQDTREVICEFGEEPARFLPEPNSRHRLRLEALVHPDQEHWATLVEFDWWAPWDRQVMQQYIAHRNELVGGPPDG